MQFEALNTEGSTTLNTLKIPPFYSFLAELKELKELKKRETLSVHLSVCPVKSVLELTILIFWAQIKLSSQVSLRCQVCLRSLRLFYLTLSYSQILKYFVFLMT